MEVDRVDVGGVTDAKADDGARAEVDGERGREVGAERGESAVLAEKDLRDVREDYFVELFDLDGFVQDVVVVLERDGLLGHRGDSGNDVRCVERFGGVGVLELGDTVDEDLERSGAEREGVRVPEYKVCVEVFADEAETVSEAGSFGRVGGDGGESEVGLSRGVSRGRKEGGERFTARPKW